MIDVFNAKERNFSGNALFYLTKIVAYSYLE